MAGAEVSIAAELRITKQQRREIRRERSRGVASPSARLAVRGVRGALRRRAPGTRRRRRLARRRRAAAWRGLPLRAGRQRRLRVVVARGPPHCDGPERGAGGGGKYNFYVFVFDYHSKGPSTANQRYKDIIVLYGFQFSDFSFIISIEGNSSRL